MNKLFLSGAVAVMGIVAATTTFASDLVIPSIGGVAITERTEPLSWYASAKLGVALPGTISMTATSPTFPLLTGTASFNPGFAGAVALGKYLTDDVRAEVELAIANNTGNTFSGTFAGGAGTTTGPLTGSVTTATLMAMGYYEFGQFGDFVPYLSAGLGVATVNSNLSYTDAALGVAGTITGSSVGFAGRVGAGFRYQVADDLDLTLDYTAMLGSNANLTYSDGTNTRNVSAGVMGHALAIGLRGSF